VIGSVRPSEGQAKRAIRAATSSASSFAWNGGIFDAPFVRNLQLLRSFPERAPGSPATHAKKNRVCPVLPPGARPRKRKAHLRRTRRGVPRPATRTSIRPSSVPSSILPTFVQAGEDPLANWPLLKPYTVHIHIKDALQGSGKVVPAGEGGRSHCRDNKRRLRRRLQRILSFETALGRRGTILGLQRARTFSGWRRKRCANWRARTPFRWRHNSPLNSG